MAAPRFENGLRVGSSFTIEPDTTVKGLATSDLDQASLSQFTIPLTDFRVWDAIHTLLPSAGATDDLGLLGNTFGTGSPTIETGDLKAAGATTRYARVSIVMPMNYDATEDVVLRFRAGMKTTVADTTATLDVECYKSDEEGGIGADICATAAQTINSLTLADIDFTITAASLSPGDLLDVRIAVAVNDGASGTAVIGQVGSAQLLCDTKG